MDELITLARIANNAYNISSVLLIDSKSISKETVFLQNIQKGIYKSDEDAARDIYGASSNDFRYKMLKHRLKKKLYNKLFFLDLTKAKSSLINIKEQECISILHQAKILFRQNELDLTLVAARKALNIAYLYEFTDHKVNALELISFCLTEQVELKHYQTNQVELEAAFTQRGLELEATSAFQIVKLNINKSVKFRREFFPNLPQIVQRLEEIWYTVDSFNSFDAYYKVYILYNELAGNFRDIAKITLQAEEWIKNNKINTLRFDAGYNKFILIYSLLRAKEYSKGLEFAEQYLQYFERRASNWFAYMENYLLLALHARKYDLALNLLHKVYENSAINRISSNAKERWMLYSSYLNLIYPSQELPKNINVFLSALPEYSKDKQGFNVAILIYQFILYLRRSDIEGLIYRIESLKKYILTHLKDNFSLRSRLFLKLLMLTVTEEFNSQQIRKKGDILYQKLLVTPTPGDAYAEIEIIPYEHLWEHILDILEKQSPGK